MQSLLATFLNGEGGPMTHVADGTILIFLGVLLVAIERPGLATVFGALGIFLIQRA
jgi:hypothetical protein